MTALHDALARIEHDAASDFTSTRLAHDLSPVSHAVRRARLARASATAVASVAAVASGGWVASALRNTPDAGPGAPPSLDATLAGLPAPLGPECEARAAHIGDRADVDHVNGAVPADSLCVLWDGETLLRADAAVALLDLHSQYTLATGQELCIEEGYRTSAQEQELIDARGPQAQDAGTSAHGWGLAVDLCSSPTPDVWLSQNAFSYGWSQPSEGLRDEPFHWEFELAYGAILATLELEVVPVGELRVLSHTSPEQIAAALAVTYGVERDVALKALTDALPPGAEGNLHGWVMPDHYLLEQWPTMNEAVDTLVAARAEQLGALGVPESDWVRVLTQASLVEVESPSPVSMPLVARVLQNRLELDMALQLDSTVQFVTDTEGPFISVEDREIDSPYNTYKYAGLPPGPIASPSWDAIQAVLNPAEGDWLYFVVVNLETGEMRFASTYGDHLENVAALQEWYEANGGP